MFSEREKYILSVGILFFNIYLLAFKTLEGSEGAVSITRAHVGKIS